MISGCISERRVTWLCCYQKQAADVLASFLLQTRLIDSLHPSLHTFTSSIFSLTSSLPVIGLFNHSFSHLCMCPLTQKMGIVVWEVFSPSVSFCQSHSYKSICLIELISLILFLTQSTKLCGSVPKVSTLMPFSFPKAEKR